LGLSLLTVLLWLSMILPICDVMWIVCVHSECLCLWLLMSMHCVLVRSYK